MQGQPFPSPVPNTNRATDVDCGSIYDNQKQINWRLGAIRLSSVVASLGVLVHRHDVYGNKP